MCNSSSIPNFCWCICALSWLLEIGAHLNVSLLAPLWEVEGNGAHQVNPSHLVEWYHGNDHPTGNLTPLISAIQVGDFEQVQFLLKKGADPNFAGKDSLTPLMVAVKKVTVVSWS